MSYYNIHLSLDNHLKTVPNLPPLQEENIRVKLGAGTKSWCRSTFLPNPAVRTSLGIGGMDEKNGAYQIDLFFPADAKYTDCSLMVDTILTYFKIGQIINGIRIMNAYPVNGYGETPNYYTIPIIIEWSYFELRPGV